MAPAGPGDVTVIVHGLIRDMKSLESILVRWSTAHASPLDVSDVYVQFGVEYNAVVRVFERYDIPTSDLYAIPGQLRTVLEDCLGEAPSPDALDQYLPRVRRLLRDVLHSLREKHPAWRHALMSDRSYSPRPRV